MYKKGVFGAASPVALAAIGRIVGSTGHAGAGRK